MWGQGDCAGLQGLWGSCVPCSVFDQWITYILVPPFWSPSLRAESVSERLLLLLVFWWRRLGSWEESVRSVFCVRICTFVLVKQVNWVPGQRLVHLDSLAEPSMQHLRLLPDTSAHVSIRQHTSAYVSIRQHTAEPSMQHLGLLPDMQTVRDRRSKKRQRNDSNLLFLSVDLFKICYFFGGGDLFGSKKRQRND